MGGVSVAPTSSPTVNTDGTLILAYVVPQWHSVVPASGIDAGAYVAVGSTNVSFSFTYTEPAVAVVQGMSETTGSAGDVLTFTLSGLDASMTVMAVFGGLGASLVTAATPASGHSGWLLVAFAVPTPVSAVTAPTAVSVLVYNAGRADTAASTTFTYACTTCGQLLSASPTTGSTLGGTPISIQAANFAVVGVADLSFTCNGVVGDVSTVYSSSLDYLYVLVAPRAASASGPATCVLSAVASTTSVSFAFNFYAASAPVLSSISSASDNVFGGSSILVTVLNIPFPAVAGDIIATFGAARVSATQISSRTQVKNGDSLSNSVAIFFTVPAASAAGSCTLTVFPAAQPTLTASTSFTYVLVPPVVDKVQPSSGLATGGTSVAINLHSFPAVSSVADVSVSFGAASATVISASTSLGSTTLLVTITYQAGTPNVQGVGTFTYISTDPVFQSISPSSGPATTAVDIHLSNMLNTSYAVDQFTVLFGSVPATVLSPVGLPNSRQVVVLRVAVPSGVSAGAVVISIKLLGKNQIALPQGSFTVAAAFVSYIFPASATTNGGVLSAVTVVGWSGATSVAAIFSSTLTSQTATGTVTLGATTGSATQVRVCVLWVCEIWRAA
jgi:hypothetical protein